MRSITEQWARIPPRARPVALWLAAALGYLALRLFAGDALLAGEVIVVWPGLGLAFLAGLEGGPRLATAPAVAAFVYALAGGRGAGTAVAFGGAVLATGLTAHLVARAGRSDAAGEAIRDFLVRTAGTAVAAVVAAVCFAGGMRLAGHELPYGFGFVVATNCATIFVVGPFLRWWLRPAWPGVASRWERIALFVAAATLTIVVNRGLLGDFGPVPYLLLLVVFWAALRAGRRGTSTVVVIVATVTVSYASADAGPFATSTHQGTAVSVSLFLIVLAATGLGFATLAAVNSASERRYRDLVERLPLVTYVNGTSLDDPASYISPQIETLLGYPRSAWLSDPGFALGVLHEDDRALLDEVMQGDGDLRQGEYRMKAADGRVVWVLDHMITLRDEQGEPAGAQGFLIDITRQKLLEEQLRQAQRIEALGLLAGGVAHDFNNLLMAISGYTELAQAHADDHERVRADLREVAATAGRAAELTRQLLAFARRQALEREIVDLNAVVREAEPLLARLLGDGVLLVTELSGDLGPVRGDSGQLSQVLLNLAVNARDAMPGGGRLTIATRNEPDAVVVTVADTGQGMDAVTREHIFEPFFTTKGVGRGTGLGLAMVHGIVEQMGGTIAVDSRPGHGATFRIALPRVQEQPQPEPATAPAAVGGGETVLLVEDEDVVRRITAEMLEGLGYRVVAAASPREALELEAEWDLLLSDMIMPGMTGRELATRLRQERPDAPVVFISGYVGPSDDDLGSPLLAKPFTLAELAQTLRDALDERVAA